MNAHQRRVRLRYNARCPRGYIGPKYGDWRVHYKRAINAPFDLSVIEPPKLTQEAIESDAQQHKEWKRVAPNVY